MELALAILSAVAQVVVCCLAAVIGRRLQFRGIGWLAVGLILTVARRVLRVTIYFQEPATFFVDDPVRALASFGDTYLFLRWITESLSPLLESFCFVWGFIVLYFETDKIRRIRLAESADHGPDTDPRSDGR